MIKKAVRGGKIDFHLPKNLTKIQPSPFTFLMVHPLYRPMQRNLESGKNLHVESGILGFGVRSTAQRIQNATSNWN